MFNQLNEFRFWVQWVLINTVSLTLCFAVASIVKELDTESHSYFAINSPNTIDCFTSGLVLGAAQWLSLKRIISNLSLKWILASSVALPVSVFTSFVIHEFLIWTYFYSSPSSLRLSLQILIGIGFLGGIVGGTISGLIQRVVLKQQVRSFGLTILLLANILGSAIGWAAGWSTAFYAGVIAVDFYFSALNIINMGVLGIIFGLVNSVIVGGGLLWALRQRLIDRQSP